MLLCQMLNCLVVVANPIALFPLNHSPGSNSPVRILTYGCGRGEQFKGNNAIGLATSAASELSASKGKQFDHIHLIPLLLKV